MNDRPAETLTLPTGIADRPLTVEQVIARWFTDPKGKPTVTRKWALKHLPRKNLSPRVIRFYADEIELYLASRSGGVQHRQAS